MWTECTVYVVCNNHQIRVVIPDDAHDARHCIRTECVAGRITGIGDKEGLDFRAFQAVYVFVAVLPEVHPFVIHAVGMYFGHSKLVAAELWDFNIGGKGRNHEDDAVPFVQQEVFLQGVEDVAHGGCSHLRWQTGHRHPGEDGCRTSLAKGNLAQAISVK